MNRVFLDTNIWIYLMEDGGERGQRAFELFSSLSTRGDTILVTPLLVGELLTKPYKHNDKLLAERYKQAFRSSGVKMVPIGEPVTDTFAILRVSGIKAPDALNLAVAGSEGCDLFVTNDFRLSRAVVPGIRFITTMDRAPL